MTSTETPLNSRSQRRQRQREPPRTTMTTDTISRTTVDVPISRAALVDMAVADRERGVSSSSSTAKQHAAAQRPYKTEPPTRVTHGVTSRPPVSTSQPPLSAAMMPPTTAAPPPPASSSSLRRSHSRSNASSSSRLDRKHSALSTASAATMTAGTLRDTLLAGSAPSSGTGSIGHLDPTQRATTVWPVFMQTVLRNANNPNAIALSGCDQRRSTHPSNSSTIHSTRSSRSGRSVRSSGTGASAREVHYTWTQYYERAHAVARVLAHLQFAPGEGAVICAKSSPDVHFVNLAVVALGGVVSHVRASWSADELVRDVFALSRASVLVLDELTSNFIDALRRTASQFHAVIVLRGDPMDLVVALDAPSFTLLTMDDVWSLAKSVDDIVIELATADSVAPHACCMLAFAYDEQGRVRGARLTHDNVLFTAATLAAAFGPLSSADRLVGYIPLYHVAAQVLELYVPLVCALSVVCAPSYDEPLVKVITRKKPTIFFATPETWTHFSAQVYRAKSDVHAGLYRWAKTRATNNSKKLLFGHDAHRSLGYMLAKTLVLNSIKKRIGLESCGACYSVLAPLDFELEKLFKTIDIPIYQLFGCAEVAGFAAINYPHAWEFGSSGRALHGTSIACDEVTHEVLLRGRNVFAGYVQQQSTGSGAGGGGGYCDAPSLPLDRAFRFRQTGFLTPNGFLKINDPPEFVVLASGDWLPVAPYERALLKSAPELDRVVLVGEARAFLSVLLFLKTAPAPSARTAATKSGAAAPLSDDALRVGKRIGSSAVTVGDAIKCQAWAVHFDDTLEALRAQCGLSGFYVRKWILMADAFAVESGELDPDTGAVKRKVVDGKYQSLLDSLYT